LSDWIVAVFLGDSIVAGFQQGPGYFPPRYYPFTNLIEASIRIKLREMNAGRDIVIVNQGLDGDSTDGMLGRFSGCVEAEKPDMVLLWGGINDLVSKKPIKGIYQNIVELVKRTEAINATPIVLNVAPVSGVHFNETIRELNRLTEGYCRRREVLYVDVHSALVDETGKLDDEYSNDGVHLSDKGYRKITPLVFDAVMGVIRGILSPT